MPRLREDALLLETPSVNKRRLAPYSLAAAAAAADKATLLQLRGQTL